MDCCAKRYHETCQIGMYTHFDRLLERYGNGSGGRLRTESRGIGRQHDAQQLERITLGDRSGNGILDQQQCDVHDEDDDDHFQEQRHYLHSLSFGAHFQENSEDVKR